MQAAGMMPGILDAQLNPFRNMMDVGGQRQAQEQAVIDAAIQKDMLGQGAEANALKDYLAILSTVGGQFGTQTATSKQSPGLLGVLGAGMQGASLFA